MVDGPTLVGGAVGAAVWDARGRRAMREIEEDEAFYFGSCTCGDGHGAAPCGHCFPADCGPSPVAWRVGADLGYKDPDTAGVVQRVSEHEAIEAFSAFAARHGVELRDIQSQRAAEYDDIETDGEVITEAEAIRRARE